MLEAAQYEDNAFVTLTYDEEHLPEDRSVSPRVLSAFMKRLRKSISPLKVRYFGCGEYGDHSERPHYHLALFGYPNCERGQSQFSARTGSCCAVCDQIKRNWEFGNVMLGSLEPQSMAYIAGYVVKKMTRPDDYRLKGRLPEFARMSLRPGVGLGMMDEVASVLLEHKLDEKMIDVPLALQHGTKKWPLGRYLRRKLRERIGREPSTPQKVLEAQAEELRPLREAAFNASVPFKEKVLEKSEGKRIQLEAREKRNRKRVVI